MISIKDKDEVIALTQELIRRYSPPGQEASAAALVHQMLVKLDYENVHTDRLGNVTGTRTGAQPGLCLLVDAHMDVMPVHQADSWSINPVGGEIHEGKIWGRGSTDIKGGLAAAIYALANLSKDDFSGTLILSASVGEEKLEGVALQEVVQKNQPDFALICEPTLCQLGVGQKGRAEFWIDVQGKPAHTSRAELGDNAIYRAMHIIQSVQNIPTQHDSLLGDGLTELIEIISTPYPGECTVPFGCHLRYDRRLVSGETHDSILKEIETALTGLDRWQSGIQVDSFTTYTGVELANEQFYPGWCIAPDSIWLQKAQRGLHSTGLNAEPAPIPYCTNASYTAGLAGIPSLIFGPSDIRLAHIVDEYVEIDELIRYYQGLQGIVKSVMSPGEI
jgi:putative selenium metabolism hydrolase